MNMKQLNKIRSHKKIHKRLKKVMFTAPPFDAAGGEVHILECIVKWDKLNQFQEMNVITTGRGVRVLSARGVKNIKVHTIPFIPRNETKFFNGPLLLVFGRLPTK